MPGLHIERDRELTGVPGLHIERVREQPGASGLLIERLSERPAEGGHHYDETNCSYSCQFCQPGQKVVKFVHFRCGRMAHSPRPKGFIDHKNKHFAAIGQGIA